MRWVMKVYILDMGYLETRKMNVVEINEGNIDNQNEIVKLPIMAVLIDCEYGKILYDLGCNPEAMNGYWPNYLKEIYPLFLTDEQHLENQLALCGVKTEDIDIIILSHLHLDHCGNLNLFLNADVYVPKEDFTYAQSLVRTDRNPETHGGYIKADLDVPIKKYNLIDCDTKLFDGIEIITLPGHTPGLLGLMLHTKNNGTIIFPQDCIYTEEIYGPPAKASGLLFDKEKFFSSIEKVRDLQSKHNAKVMFAHDDVFFNTIKKAPFYYD